MATPHIEAEKGAIAKTVLMPGDPLRAQFIAEKFLDNYVRFNTIRNMFGFTGQYEGKPVSIMGSGMGIPSISLYAHELYSFYGVENIIRIGSCGSYSESLGVYETIIASSAYSESSYAKCKFNDDSKVQYPDARLNQNLRKAADELGIRVHEGMIISSDVFYYEDNVLDHVEKVVKENNILAAEMEAYGLFATAKVLQKNAACILTVSDNIITHVETSSEERRSRLIDMIKIALKASGY